MVGVRSDLKPVLETLLETRFGDTVSLSQLMAAVKQSPVLEPGARLWPSSSPGIYIVTAGKVRVLDQADGLICSLSPGNYFGADSVAGLITDGVFAPYQVRSARHCELIWIEAAQIQRWIKQFPTLRSRFLTAFSASQTTHVSPVTISPAPVLPPVAVAPPVPPRSRPPAKFPRPQVRQTWQRLTQRYPFVHQQSNVDCGVACLVMIGQYWGKQLNLNHLRELAQVDRSGATLKGLMQAAEAVGFTTRPVKATWNQLTAQELPAIVHWEDKHYIVLYAIKGKTITIADPEIGCRRITHAQFLEKWTGYTLLLKPTAQLGKATLPQSGLGRFLSLIQPHWPVLTEIALTSLVIQIFGLVTPLLTQLLLDRVVVQRSEQTLIALGIGLIIFSGFRLAMQSLRQYLLYHTANRVDLALVVGFINHTLRLRLSYFETRYVGDIVSRIAENQTIRRFLTGEALTTGLDLLTAFVYLGLMFWYSWSMAALALVLLPALGILALIFTPFLQQNSRETFAAKNRENSYLIEFLNGINTIKSMALERTVRWRWEQLFSQYIRLNFQGQMLRERLEFASGFVEVMVSQTLLLFGIWQVIHNQLTVGQLLAFNMLLGNVIRPFQRLIALWDDLQEVLIAVERLNDVLEAPPESDPALMQPNLPLLQGQIQFENVTFRYNLDAPKNTLANLSFAIAPGQTVAIVGRSGSGKTTLAKLLLGLYLPTDGKIWLDGHDISTVNLTSLRQQVGVVDQNTFLFGGNVRDNLMITAPNATMAEVETAATLAGADQFIAELPMGYDTQIGEGGGMLSGGQRQRLAIARALLGRPRLLVLDEATSALDTESERIIQENFQRIFHRQTTIVIAHRLSTIRQADVILVLDRGVLVEQGSHDVLMAQRGPYYHLNQQQLTMGSTVGSAA
jgi:HlyB family type I secretion system ABC transporter